MSHSGLPDAWSFPRLEPASRRRYREFTQGVISDGLNILADKCLDQQRLRFLFGKTPRAQVEQQVFVKRAGGCAMAAGYVVSEDFQFRLIVGLSLVGQQQRARHHLGVRLLRVGTNHDAALKHRMSAVVDHRTKDFTALTVRY